MKKKHNVILSHHGNRKEDILRFESRLLNRRVIDKVLKPDLSFPELLVEPETLKGKLLKDFEQLVSTPGKQNDVHFDQNNRLMEIIKERKKRCVFSKFLSVRGLKLFLDDFNFDYREIKEFLLRHFSKAQAYRILSEIKEERQFLLSEKHVDLVEEMRVKLTA